MKAWGGVERFIRSIHPRPRVHLSLITLFLARTTEAFLGSGRRAHLVPLFSRRYYHSCTASLRREYAVVERIALTRAGRATHVQPQGASASYGSGRSFVAVS